MLSITIWKNSKRMILKDNLMSFKMLANTYPALVLCTMKPRNTAFREQVMPS